MFYYNAHTEPLFFYGKLLKRYGMYKSELAKFMFGCIYGLLQVAPVTKKITEKRLKLYGHVKRRDEWHVLRRMVDAPVPGKRRRGRQETRWKDSRKRDMESVELKVQDVELETRNSKSFRRPQLIGKAWQVEEEEWTKKRTLLSLLCVSSQKITSTIFYFLWEYNPRWFDVLCCVFRRSLHKRCSLTTSTVRVRWRAGCEVSVRHWDHSRHSPWRDL